MPRQCSVFLCTSKEWSNVQLFKVRESEAHSWEEIVNKVNGNHKRKATYVCVEHFRKEDYKMPTYIIMTMKMLKRNKE
ncbi:THAP-type domain-containing protein [Aphis craccivora]|uniref:THAP-type domain-containing protein n=1 Tax=Aphis craccivora TaxID=307492 RepID=A0A6G0XAR6_APHCR|nr:THAP-type domain-containing protein [Aphis craccivora]